MLDLTQFITIKKVISYKTKKKRKETPLHEYILQSTMYTDLLLYRITLTYQMMLAHCTA